MSDLYCVGALRKDDVQVYCSTHERSNRPDACCELAHVVHLGAFRSGSTWLTAVGCRLCVASGDGDTAAKLKRLVPRWQARLAADAPCEQCHAPVDAQADLAFVRGLMPQFVLDDMHEKLRLRIERFAQAQGVTVNFGVKVSVYNECLFLALATSDASDSELPLIRNICVTLPSPEVLLECMSGAFGLAVARFGGLARAAQINVWRLADDDLKVVIAAELHRVAARKAARSFDIGDLAPRLGGAFVDEATYFRGLIRVCRAWSLEQRIAILEGAPTFLHAVVLGVTLFDGAGAPDAQCVLHAPTHSVTFSKTVSYCFASMSLSWRQTNTVFARFDSSTRICIALREAYCAGKSSSVCLCRLLNHRLPDGFAGALVAVALNESSVREQLSTMFPLDRLCNDCAPSFRDVLARVLVASQLRDEGKPLSARVAERDALLARGDAWKEAYLNALTLALSAASPAVKQALWDRFDDTERAYFRAKATRSNQ